MAGKLVKAAAVLVVAALVWKFVLGGDEASAPEPQDVDRID